MILNAKDHHLVEEESEFRLIPIDGKLVIADYHDCILALTGAYHSSGGIAAVNRLILKALMDQGHRSDVYLLNEPGGVDIPKDVEASISGYHTYAGDKRAFVFALWSALAKSRGAFVFCDHINIAAAVAPWRYLLGKRYVVWLHGIEVLPPKPDLEGKIGLRGAWRGICSSQFTLEAAKASFPGLSLAVCDLALDIETLPPIPATVPGVRLNSSSLQAVSGSQHELGNQVILHVGRMSAGERYKGQDVLIEAFPMVAKRFPESQLVLVGDGDDRVNLATKAAGLPAEMQAKVFFTGPVTNELLERLYQTCFMFAMSSRGEGFGIVYLEAMAHAKPCLGGSVDAAQFVIQKGVSGLLVDNPGSPAELAEKICWMLERPQIAQRMGIAGYELVRSNYLLPHFKDKFWKALAD